ncbi:hypothetical protein D3C84_487790 [compost metagenome]
MRFVVVEGVAVAHDTGGRVEAGDGQRAAQWRSDRLWESRRYASRDHGDAADGQGGDAVQCGDGERAALGQGWCVGVAAVTEVFLVDRQLAAVHVEAVEDHRIVIVVDLQYQVGGAAVAVRIGDGVGEGVCAVATAVQGFEVGITGIQRVGVGAVGVEYQGAVGAGESAGGDRTSAFTDGYPVGALYVVGQHVAVEGQQGFRGGAIAVVHAFWQVVDDVDVEAARGRGAVVVDRGHGELFRQGVGAVGRRVRFVVVEGVAVAHDTGRRVKAGDGQRAAQWRGDRLWEARRHTRGDHGDAADGQAGDTVQCSNSEGAVLGQRHGIRSTAVTEVFLEDGEFAALDVQTANRHRIIVVVDLQHQGRRTAVAIGVRQRIGEAFGAVATAVQRFEIRIAGVQGVGVSAVGVKCQGAVGAGECAGGDRAGVFSNGYPVGALHVVAQYVAVEGQQGFRRRRSVAVVHASRQVIDDIHIQ